MKFHGLAWLSHSQRRRERGLSTEDRAGLWQWGIPLGISLSFSIIVVFLFPIHRPLHFSDFTVGSISPRRVVAPFHFEILKTREEYERDRLQAIREVHPVFERSEAEAERVLGRLERFWDAVIRFREGQMSASEKIAAFRMQFPIPTIPPDAWLILLDPKGPFGGHQGALFRDRLKQILRDLYRQGILDQEKPVNVADGRLIIRTEEEERFAFLDACLDLREAGQRIREALSAYYGERSPKAQIGTALLIYYLKPNLLFDRENHETRVKEAVARVPLSSGFVYENELIVDSNQRITPEIRRKLDSLSAKMIERGMVERGLQRILPFLGRWLFVLFLCGTFAFFLFMIQSRILHETRSVLLVILVFLLVVLGTFGLRELHGSEYLVPITLGAMLLFFLFDGPTAFAGTTVLSLLASALWGNDFTLFVHAFFTGILGILVVRRIRSRNQMVQAVFYLIGTQIVLITVVGWMRFLPWNQILSSWQFGAMNGLFTPILASGMLALIESVFDVTTDYTLLELSNLNHPLLKRLSVEAPGTYQHSIQVGNLAELAAQAVGANSLLARVGSYYHDIGKLDKAEYFVENQIGSENPHKRLAPSMSALILLTHVKRGLELSEEYRLPKAIREIIAEHHGKTVMSFFYKKALDKAGPNGVESMEYRYPGPRPRSKEAALVMLADAVEAASRALKEPTYGRLKGVIEEIVTERFQSGELDESPLTLRDLEKIKERFLNLLAAMFHARIEYPETEKPRTGRASLSKQERHVG